MPHPPNKDQNRRLFLFNLVLTVDSMITCLMTVWCILVVTSVVIPLMMSQNMIQSFRREEESPILLSPLNPHQVPSVKSVVAQYTPPLITHQSLSSNSPLSQNPQESGWIERTNRVYNICVEACQGTCLASWQWMFKEYDCVKQYLHKYVKEPGPKVVYFCW